jgi:hypothetical protein
VSDQPKQSRKPRGVVARFLAGALKKVRGVARRWTVALLDLESKRQAEIMSLVAGSWRREDFTE